MKTSNWKSPGPDAVPNFWPKQPTALHQHLLNAYNQAIEHPESLPNWFTTAQTYFTKVQRNREPQELQTNCLLINILQRTYIDFNRKKLCPHHKE